MSYYTEKEIYKILVRHFQTTSISHIKGFQRPEQHLYIGKEYTILELRIYGDEAIVDSVNKATFSLELSSDEIYEKYGLCWEDIMSDICMYASDKIVEQKYLVMRTEQWKSFFEKYWEYGDCISIEEEYKLSKLPRNIDEKNTDIFSVVNSDERHNPYTHDWMPQYPKIMSNAIEQTRKRNRKLRTQNK